MAHHYNAVEVLELVLAVWVAGPMIVLIWLTSSVIIDFFRRLRFLWKERHSHTTAIYRRQ